jgi:hypothetical protein
MRFAKLVGRADKLSLRLRLRPLRRGRHYFSDEGCVDVSMRWRCHQHRLADMNGFADWSSQLTRGQATDAASRPVAAP